MTDIAIGILGLCLTTIVMVLAVALSHHKLSTSLSAGFKGLSATITMRSNGGTAGGGAGTSLEGPLVWLPLWKQTGGLLPDGNLDPQQYNDCGETCVAMIVAAVRGVIISPGDIREQLGGPGRSGLTTAEDLARALELNHVPASAIAMTAATAFSSSVTLWAAALPCILLGRWLGANSLHWMLVDGYSTGVIRCIDPWTGTERLLSRSMFDEQFGGWLVRVAERCHYDMRTVPTPGTSS